MTKKDEMSIEDMVEQQVNTQEGVAKAEETPGENTSPGEIETAPAKKRGRPKKNPVTSNEGNNGTIDINGKKGVHMSVISIDGSRTVQTEADKAKNDLIDLTVSLKTDKILSGTIQGVERGYDGKYNTAAVVYHGVFKVIIPAEDAVELPDDLRGQDPEDVYYYLLNKRLGSEVDFIVNRIFYDDCTAYASRLDAMVAKRKKYYYGFERNGGAMIEAGVCAEARVVSVIRAGIFVDLFGVETYIPLKELSYQRMLDATSSFQSGQRILVKVLEVDKTEKNNIQVTASVKQAMENPYAKALRRYTVGNRYVGTVSMVDTNGVFVSLDGGIDCLCSYPKRGRPPRGARVTVSILGINQETNRIWGAITHTAIPR